jgi:hypothetical protein
LKEIRNVEVGDVFTLNSPSLFMGYNPFSFVVTTKDGMFLVEQKSATEIFVKERLLPPLSKISMDSHKKIAESAFLRASIITR